MTLIQEARQALNQGDKTRAQQLALLATSEPAQEEQAWLILASLSEPQQALLYIENAMKVNPDSQAARKAIRLVYGQMSANEETQAQMDDIPPIRPLEDTSPIPVADITLTENAPKAEQKSEAQEPETVDTEAPSPPSITKSALRDKLRQRARTQAIEKPAAPAAPVDETVFAEPPAKKKIRFIKNKALIETDPAASAEETEMAPEVETEKELERSTPAPLAEENRETVPAAPEPKAPPAAAVEIAAPDAPEGELPQKAVEEVLSGKSNRKVAVNKPAEDSHAESAVVEKGAPRRNHQDPANVDTIELILVSIAAILLPLLVFLYFYLTK
jgi:hypothetical protein